MASAASLQKQLQKLVNQANQQQMEFNASEAEKTRAYNSQEASTARQWQTEMSNTAHQREVADLKAAGLNPVLAANSGAQSYTTSAASAQNASASLDNAAGAVSNAYVGEMSSAATRYAANQSLKAAQAQASATMYAANKSFEASKNAWETKERIEMNKPQATIYGIIDKVGTKVFNEFRDSLANKKNLTNHITKGRVIGVSGVSKMSSTFKSAIDKQLTYMNIPVTDKSRAYLYNALSNRDNAKLYGKYIAYLTNLRR